MGTGFSTIASKNREQVDDGNRNRSNIQNISHYFSNVRIEGRPPIRTSPRTELISMPSNEMENKLIEVNYVENRAIHETKPALSIIPQKKHFETGKSNGKH